MSSSGFDEFFRRLEKWFQPEISVTEAEVNQLIQANQETIFNEKFQDLRLGFRPGIVSAAARVRVKDFLPAVEVKADFRLVGYEFARGSHYLQFQLEGSPDLNAAGLLGNWLVVPPLKLLMRLFGGDNLNKLAPAKADFLTIEGRMVTLCLDRYPQAQAILQKEATLGTKQLRYFDYLTLDLLELREGELVCRPRVLLKEAYRDWVYGPSGGEVTASQVVASDQMTEPAVEISPGSEVMSPKEAGFYRQLKQMVLSLTQNFQPGTMLGAVGNYLKFAPDLFLLLIRLIRDPEVPLPVKMKLFAAVAYCLAPIDIVPDQMPGGIGLIDDLLYVASALHTVFNQVPPEVIQRHWRGQEDLLSLLQRIVALADHPLLHRIWSQIRLRQKA